MEHEEGASLSKLDQRLFKTLVEIAAPVLLLFTCGLVGGGGLCVHTKITDTEGRMVGDMRVPPLPLYQSILIAQRPPMADRQLLPQPRP